MKRYTVSIVALLAILVLISAGCGLGAATPTPTAAPPTATVAAGARLELTGPTASKTLTLAAIKALPAVEGWAGIKSSTGKITAPAKYKGVSLATLAQQIGGLGANQGLQLTAKDGYAMTMSTDQALNGNFIAYDPGTGDETKNGGKLTAILAYEVDGKPLPEDSDGTFRLMVISDKNLQVVDGHWSVKWITRVDIKSLAEEWTLALTGKIAEKMDRGTFESCSGASCHGKTWTDDKAQKWTGTPLWLVIGRIDDDNKHSTGAYSNDLADKGYTVKVIAKDGFTATFPSSRIKRDDSILVANAVNSNPLDDKNFPLKLVGAGLTGKESPGQIAQIVVEFGQAAPAAATAVPPTAVPPTAVPPTPTKAALAATPAATGAAPAAAFAIKGAVEKAMSWSLADLKSVGVVKLELEHPKKGKGTYEGVRLNALLSLAKPTAAAKTLTLTASDGFKADIPLADVLKCADCLLSIDSTGALSSAMPGMEGATWVKNLATIEVK
jgi:DMSO/TMAO reductase YedYZ molybdopterin-dependent catalytic subunit